MLRYFALAVVTVLLGVGATSVHAQGPDVIVGNLTDINNYGNVGGIYAYSVGTESCNLGNQELAWIDTGPMNNQHPVIPQDMFKLMDGRFTHIGASWLKHGFCALSLSFCGPCAANGTCDYLGIGCSDPYGAGLNGSQGGLGPRSQVNAHTGAFPYPVSAPGFSGTIARRMQVSGADLNPGLNPGALYFVSSHYVSPDDAAAGNGNNNASYRRVTVGSNPSNYPLSFAGSTQQEQPALQAWQDFQPSVTLVDLQIPNEGLFIVGYDVIDNGNGTWRYEYVVHNMNSDRSGQSFSVPIPTGVNITDVFFHDIEWHSGEPYDTTDWSVSINPGTAITWSGQDFATNPNANALRWSMHYTFSFTADAPPSNNTATIELFKPGTPTNLTLTVSAPDGNFIPAVTDVTCAQTNPNSPAVDLNWTNQASYTGIEITRDGVTIANLGGTATSYNDANPGFGTHTYTVRAAQGVDLTAAIPCDVDVLPAPPSAFTCTQPDPLNTNVQLSWTNPTSYSSLTLARDGVTIANLAGSATSYTDNGAPLGNHLYELFGASGGVDSSAADCTINVIDPPPLGFTASIENASGTFDPNNGQGSVSVNLYLEESAANPGFPSDVSGFTFGITCDPSIVTPVGVTESPSLLNPEFFDFELLSNGATIGVIMDFQNVIFLELNSITDMALVDFDTNPATLTGFNSPVATTMQYQSGLGSGVPVDNLVVVGFDSVSPTLVPGVITLNPLATGLFRRSDANSDGSVNIADAVSILDYLFNLGPATCLSALDSNDDGSVNIADGVYTLDYLFSMGPDPAAPFPDCGSDPTADSLDCQDYPGAC